MCKSYQWGTNPDRTMLTGCPEGIPKTLSDPWETYLPSKTKWNEKLKDYQAGT